MLWQASVVAIGDRAIALEGPPGSGKSSLALALIQRGAALIGDDGVTLNVSEGKLLVSPPPNTAGLLEVRGVGLIEFQTAQPTQLALVLGLGQTGERLPESIPNREILGCTVPLLAFDPGHIAPAERAEWALRVHGIPV